MSLAVRVIPCLDVDDGRVVKGVHFENLRDAGDPVELAAEYYRQGADELTFLDVTASSSHRQTMVNVVTRTAEQIFIPLTVGGGVRTPEDVDSLLRCGADKVSVNTAAINDPTLISRVAERFGNQVLVLSVDARRERGEQHTQSGFEVTTMGGRKSTGIDALWWARRAEELGAVQCARWCLFRSSPPEAQERHRISRLPSPPARTPYLPHQSSTTARLQSARSRTSCAVLAMPCAREAEGQ